MYRWEVLYDLLKNKGQLSVAEVGVFEGKTVRYLTERISFNKYILIDPYIMYNNYRDSKANQSVLNNAYNNIKAFSDCKKEIVFMQMFSKEAAKLISNSSLDLVFIDANHDYEFVKDDILAWTEKVKSGGILAGHDYNYLILQE